SLNAINVRERDDLAIAFAGMRRDRPDALFGSNSPTLTYRLPIVLFAAENRIPAMYGYTELSEEGGLMSYGASRTAAMRGAATYVARILNGAKPGDLPIEQPTQFDFVINLRTAKALGLELPSSIMLLADELIE